MHLPQIRGDSTEIGRQRLWTLTGITEQIHAGAYQNTGGEQVNAVNHTVQTGESDFSGPMLLIVCRPAMGIREQLTYGKGQPPGNIGGEPAATSGV